MKTDDASSLPPFKTVNALEYEPANSRSVLYMVGGGQMYIHRNPQFVVETWCLRHGSTMQGRIDALRKLTGVRTKTPVLISEESRDFYFPLRSNERNRNSSNIWLNEDKIAKLKEEGRQNTVVIFSDNSRLKIPYNIRMINRQRKNCKKLREALEEVKALDKTDGAALHSRMENRS